MWTWRSAPASASCRCGSPGRCSQSISVEAPMHQFADAKGRTWDVSLTVAEVEIIDEVHGVDLGAEIGIKKLFESTKTFLGVLWLFIGKQVEERNLTPDEVKKAFDGDAWEAAQEAVI